MVDLQTVRYLARSNNAGQTVRFARMLHVFVNTSRERRNPNPRKVVLGKLFDDPVKASAYAKWYWGWD